VLGISLAGANFALSYFYMKKAMRGPSARFVGAVFKGMGLRMIGVLGMLILVFLFIPVDVVAFSISFLTVVLIGLAVEAVLLMRVNRPE
jgi:hypothetical protein